MIDGVSALTVQKTDTGTWILSHPDNTYTGTTTISAGKLILSGNLASAITVTAGILSPQGTPATTGGLVLNSTGRFEVRPGDTLTVGGSATLAGELDIIAPPDVPSGASFTILSIAGTTAGSGTFTGKPEAATFSASGYDWQITYTGGDGNDVVLTNVSPPPPLSAAGQWRQLYFGTTENTGSAADTFDANNDGESNLIEFATGQNPNATTRAGIAVAKTATSLEFTYSRSKAAFDEGYGFTVEYSDTLAISQWIAFGPGSIVADGPLQTLKATIPTSANGTSFARLRITAP
jgi:autotransporter-associated beta strand protein